MATPGYKGHIQQYGPGMMLASIGRSDVKVNLSVLHSVMVQGWGQSKMEQY